MSSFGHREVAGYEAAEAALTAAPARARAEADDEDTDADVEGEE